MTLKSEERTGMNLMEHLFLSYLADRERESCARDTESWARFCANLRRIVSIREGRPWIALEELFRWATPQDVIRASREIDVEGPALWNELLKAIETDPKLKGPHPSRFQASGIRFQASGTDPPSVEDKADAHEATKAILEGGEILTHEQVGAELGLTDKENQS